MESLDIKALTMDRFGALFQVYVGFGEWQKLEMKRDRDATSVIRLPDYEELIDNDEAMDDLEITLDNYAVYLDKLPNGAISNAPRKTCLTCLIDIILHNPPFTIEGFLFDR